MTFDRGEFADEANAIQQTYDGGIIVAGNSCGDIWIMKLNNADGQYLWQKTYDLSSNDNAYAIQQTVRRIYRGRRIF